MRTGRCRCGIEIERIGLADCDAKVRDSFGGYHQGLKHTMHRSRADWLVDCQHRTPLTMSAHHSNSFATFLRSQESISARRSLSQRLLARQHVRQRRSSTRCTYPRRCSMAKRDSPLPVRIPRTPRGDVKGLLCRGSMLRSVMRSLKKAGRSGTVALIDVCFSPLCASRETARFLMDSFDFTQLIYLTRRFR